MHISRIYIKNYRNFEEFDLYIPNGEPLTIIGSNNSGKTNLLKAIRLVLDPNTPPWERKLSEEDFCWHSGSEPWKKGEEIVITITLSNIVDGEEIKSFLYSLSPVLQDGEVGDLEANISFVYAPLIYGQSEYDLIEDYIGFLVAGRYHPSGYYYLNNGESQEYEQDILKSLCACKDKKEFYKYFYLSEEDIEKIREGKEDLFEKRLNKQLYVNRIRKHINLLYLDALRDVKNDFNQGYNSLVSQLFRADIRNGNNKKVTLELTDAFKSLRTHGSIPETALIMEEIEGRLQNEDVNLLTDKAEFSIGTPKITLENIGRYFNFLVDLNEDLKKSLDVNIIGLGYQNLAYISAIFALFELKKEIYLNDSDEKVKIIYNLLLIEEPESHLDVQNQKFLHTQIERKTEKMSELKKGNEGKDFFAFTQVIQTSHSTHLVSKSDLKNIVVIQRHVKKTKAINIDNVLKKDKKTYEHNRRILRQYLDATRSALLFAKKIVLVEGLSEKYVLGAIINSYLTKEKPEFKNIDIDSEGIEIIEVGGKNFDPFISLYSSDGLQNKCLSLRDGDICLQEEAKRITDYSNKYSELNGDVLSDKAMSKKNIFTFEIDTFFIPNPEENSTNNTDYLKLILYRFMKDGVYFKKDETFKQKIGVIDKFEGKIKQGGVNKDDVESFFNKILGYEVSKPTLSLYLSSLLKAKLLNDPIEFETWSNGYSPDDESDIKRIDELKDFIIPKYIEEGLKWLITEQN